MDDKPTLLRVGQLAERVGKSTRALRLYEQMGILLPHSRTATGYRMYGEDAINQLMWIDKLQSLGVSLSELQEFIAQLGEHQNGPAVMTDLTVFYRQKLSEARQKIREMETVCEELEASLAYISDCSGCNTQTSINQCTSCQNHHHSYQSYQQRKRMAGQATNLSRSEQSSDTSPLNPLMVSVVARTISQSKLI